MEIEQSRIDELVSRPSESLNVEIKRWINPDEPQGIAKIVKAALAIRNRNGGFLLIGFGDKTWIPGTGAIMRACQALSNTIGRPVES